MWGQPLYLGAAILFCGSTALLWISDYMDIGLCYGFLHLYMAWATCDVLVISFLIKMTGQMLFRCSATTQIFCGKNDFSQLDKFNLRIGLAWSCSKSSGYQTATRAVSITGWLSQKLCMTKFRPLKMPWGVRQYDTSLLRLRFNHPVARFSVSELSVSAPSETPNLRVWFNIRAQIKCGRRKTLSW